MTSPNSSKVSLTFDLDNKVETIVDVLTELQGINWTLTMASDPFLAYAAELRHTFLSLSMDASEMRASADDPERYAEIRRRFDNAISTLRVLIQERQDFAFESSKYIPDDMKSEPKRVMRDAYRVLKALKEVDEETLDRLLYGPSSIINRITELLNAAEEYASLRVSSIKAESILVTAIASSGTALTALVALVTGRSVIKRNKAEAAKAIADAAKAPAEISRICAETIRLEAEALRIYAETFGANVDNVERLIKLTQGVLVDDTATQKMIKVFLLIQYPHLKQLPNTLDSAAWTLLRHSRILGNVTEVEERPHESEGE